MKITKQYVVPILPTAYNPSIRTNISNFVKAKKTAEWEDLKESFAALTGARLGITENIRYSFDTTYQEQLADTVLGYTTVSLKYYFDNLTVKWCKLTTAMRSQMKVEYFRGWEEEEHVTAFARHLDLEQMELDTNIIAISDEDKRNHYILQMY